MPLPDVRDPDELEVAIDNEITFADEYENEVSPKLVQGDTEIEPIAVTRFGGTLPWDTTSKQLQCGESVTDSGGDMSIRLNYEAVMTLSQFKKLAEMRRGENTVKLVSASYTGAATFDQLKYDRIPDANDVLVRGEGEVNEPIYTIQLQSKEGSTSSNSSSGS